MLSRYYKPPNKPINKRKFKMIVINKKNIIHTLTYRVYTYIQRDKKNARNYPGAIYEASDINM